jgi:peptide/nickel transport system substrate-binding protein
MTTTRRGLLTNGIRLAGGLALAACVPPQTTTGGSPAASPSGVATAAKATKGVLKWGSSYGVPTTYSPYHSTGISAVQVYSVLFDGLTTRDKDFKLQPKVAQSWRMVDPLTWEFKLRDGIKFHNGDALTADDVKFVVDYNNDKTNASLYTTQYQTIDRVEILDKLTLRIHTKAPDPFVADKFSTWPGYIVPSNYYLKLGKAKFDQNPVGSGPYMFKDQESGVRLTLVANPAYWRAEPTASQINLFQRPDLASRVAGLKTGELNFIDDLTYDQWDDINSTKGLSAVSVKVTNIQNWPINTLVAPLNNKLVRQALNISIDRKGVNDSLFRGKAQLCNGPVMPYEFGYVSDFPVIPYDPARAKQLLQDAGYKGEQILFEWTPSGQLVPAVQAGWKQVGLNVELRSIDAATSAQKRAQHSFLGIYVGGTSSLYGDPNSSIWRQFAPGGTHRYWNPTSDEFDKLGAEQATSLDQDRRRAIWRRMSEIMNDEVPWLNLFSTTVLAATGPDVAWDPGYYANDELDPERLKFK